MGRVDLLIFMGISTALTAELYTLNSSFTLFIIIITVLKAHTLVDTYIKNKNYEIQMGVSHNFFTSIKVLQFNNPYQKKNVLKIGNI